VLYKYTLVTIVISQSLIIYEWTKAREEQAKAKGILWFLV